MSAEVVIKIPGRRPGEEIKCTLEDLKEYKECLTSKFKPAFFLNLLGSTCIAATAPIKNVATFGLKRFGVFAGCFFTGQLLTQIYCTQSCFPVMEKLIQSKTENSFDRMYEGSEPPSQSSEPESYDFTLPPLSDADMSPPSSFSLDPGFKIYGTEEEKHEPRVAETKPVTYDELRARSRDRVRQRPYNNTFNLQDNIPERKDGDDISRTWPSKTNIYGDVLE